MDSLFCYKKNDSLLKSKEQHKHFEAVFYENASLLLIRNW